MSILRAKGHRVCEFSQNFRREQRFSAVSPRNAGTAVKAAAAHTSVFAISAPQPVTSTTTPDTSQRTENPGLQHAEQEKPFSWAKQWYPVAIESDLPPDRPTATRLLGQALVLWRDDALQWHCWQDMCPHRLVPLSEGRVEKGELMCSYHGWTFGPDGRCTNIPQAENDRGLATALASKRSCAVTHPVQVINGLVWVWAEASKDADKESQLRRPASHPLADDADAVWIARWFSRDLPYGSDVLAENVLDPSHVGFSHHGILGNRYKPRQLSMQPPASMSAQDGWELTLKRGAIGKRPASEDLTAWQPPSLVKYEYSNGMVMLTHAVPTDPGRSRLFFAMLQPGDKAPKVLKVLMPLLQLPWLRYMSHFSQHNVLDGDSVFLHHQDQSLQQRDWKKDYFMPTDKDAGVVALRRWLTERAGPIPWGPGALPQPRAVGMRQLLDRLSQHTETCPSCSQALKVFTALRGIAAVACLLSVAIAFGALQRSVGLVVRVKFSCLTLGLAALTAWFSKERQKLIYVPYHHHEHN